MPIRALHICDPLFALFDGLLNLFNRLIDVLRACGRLTAVLRDIRTAFLPADPPRAIGRQI
jgi:hypothetical protein